MSSDKIGNNSRNSSGLNRRDFLAGAMAVGAASASMVAGMPGEARAQAAAPSKGGVLNIGLGGGGAGGNVDAHAWAGTADGVRVKCLYDTLLWQTFPNGGQLVHDMRLAESIEMGKAADEWTIRLRPGVEFHHGKTVSADDLLFTIQRILTPETRAVARGRLAVVDLANSTKLDDRTVRLKLSAPSVIFDEQLAGATTGIVPMDYDPKNPVGTGPWRFKSFTPGQRAVYTRFENYFGQVAYCDEVNLIDINDDSARVNALLAGQVHAVNLLPYNQIRVIENTPGLAINSSKSGANIAYYMKLNMAPFDDVRVRQAFRLLIDRELIVRQALGGHGLVGSDLFGRFDDTYSLDLVRKRDPEQAKALLKEAGHEKLSVDLAIADIAPGVIAASEIFKANAAEVGVTINLRRMDPSTLDAQLKEIPFGVKSWPAQAMASSLATVFGAKSPRNDTNFNIPEHAKLYDEMMSEPDPAKRKELVHAMQVIQFERGGNIVPYFYNVVDGHTKQIAGIQPHDHLGMTLGAAQLNYIHFV